MNDANLLWKNEYLIGIDEIDKQHQDLLIFINDMLCHVPKESAFEQEYFITTIIPGIKSIEDHFMTEEKWMKDKKYHKYREHKRKHDRMLNDLKGIIAEIQSGKRELVLINLALYVREWFIKHIYEKDIPMAAHIK